MALGGFGGRLAAPRFGRGRALCGLAISTAALLWSLHVLALVASLDAGSLPRALLGALLGAAAADLVTGLVHWACDTWGDERTPWLGPTLIYAFREHHEDPRAMLASDWTSVNREPGIAAALALVLLSLPAVQGALVERPFAWALLCGLVAYGAAANQLHRWAHDGDPPRWVRRAQRLGLVLSPARHARHHAGPHTSAYCISTGWLNPALDRIGFWRALERAVTSCTGAVPRAYPTPNRRLSHS